MPKYLFAANCLLVSFTAEFTVGRNVYRFLVKVGPAHKSIEMFTPLTCIKLNCSSGLEPDGSSIFLMDHNRTGTLAWKTFFGKIAETFSEIHANKH